MGSKVCRKGRKKKTYEGRLDDRWEGESLALRLVWMETGMAVEEEVGVDKNLGCVGLKGELVPVLGVDVEVEGEWDDVLALLLFRTKTRMNLPMTQRNLTV